jgi:HEAT repeat protein
MVARFSRFLKRLLGAEADRGRSASVLPGPGLPDTDSFPVLFRLLSRKDDAPRRAEAYARLRQILSDASSHGLCRLEALCRERTRAEGDMDWTRFPSDGFCPEGIASGDRIWGYALASFHPNGFLREKAVLGLASMGTGEEMPFLLLRLRDCVDQVRIRAEAAMDVRLRTAQSDAATRLLLALPILRRLRASERRSPVPLLERIGKRIALDGKALRSGLESADWETRRFSFELALGTEGIGLDALQEAVLREPAGPVRLFALRSMQARLTFPQAGGFIGRLLRDPFSPVRRLALDLRCGHALEESGAVLREMALSLNSGVRHAARFHMHEAAREKPVALYRKVLAGGSGNALVGALRGLGEVGERQDAELLHPFLKHGRAMVVRSAIRSLGSLQASFLATLLTPFLSDPRPGVSREALLALKARTSGLNPEKLNAARKSAALPHVRRHILKLLFAIGYWESLPYILEAFSEVDAGGSAEEKEMAGKALARWLQRSKSYFIEPDRGSKEKCAESLARFGSALDEKSRKALAFLFR